MVGRLIVSCSQNVTPDLTRAVFTVLLTGLLRSGAIIKAGVDLQTDAYLQSFSSGGAGTPVGAFDFGSGGY